MNDVHAYRRWLWAGLPVLAVYLAHVWFGANSSFSALVLAATEGLLLAVFAVAPGSRPSFARLRGLTPLAGLLALVLVVAAVSLTALAAGGAHPVWSYVQATPAAGIDRSSTIIEIVKSIGLACILVVGALMGADERLSPPARKLILWGGGVFCLWALVRFAGGGQLSGSGRLEGAFGSANCAATVIGVLILLSLPDLFKKPGLRVGRPAGLDRRLVERAPAAALFLLFLGCFIATASRWGTVSLLVALTVFAAGQVWGGRLRLRSALGLGSLIIVLGGALLLLKGGLLVERFGSTQIDQDARGQMFALHWKTFLQSPLQGYGLGSFAEINRLVLDIASFRAAGDIRDLHNVYLQWLEEGGILAAVPMFLCVAGIIGLTIWKARGRSTHAGWITALIAGDVMVLTHGLSDFALQVPSIAAFWSLLLGLQLGLAVAPVRESAGRRRRAVAP